MPLLLFHERLFMLWLPHNYFWRSKIERFQEKHKATTFKYIYSSFKMGQCQSSSPTAPTMVDSSLQYSLDLLDATSVSKKKHQGRRRRRSSGCSCGDTGKDSHECHSMAFTASTASSKSKEDEDEARPVPSVTIQRQSSTSTSNKQRRRGTQKATLQGGSQRDMMDASTLTVSTRRSCTSNSSSTSSRLHSRRELLKAKELAYKASHPDWEHERLQSSTGVLVHAHWKVIPPQGAR